MVKRRHRNGNLFCAAQNGLRENVENAFSCRGPGRAQKEERVIPVVACEDEEGAQKHPCGDADESRTHVVGQPT